MSMTPLDMFGLFAVILMLVFYALEKRHHLFILAFSLSCLLGSAYGFLQGAWPFGVVELVWTVVVGWRWWKEYSGLRLAVPTDTRGCGRCGHPIGYHHAEGDRCTCKDCDCPGYLSVPRASQR